MSTKGRNISNLAAWAWEWKQDNLSFQMIALRNVYGAPRMYLQHDGDTTWAPYGQMADKWTTDGTWKSFKAVVDRFFAEAESASH